MGISTNFDVSGLLSAGGRLSLLCSGLRQMKYYHGRLFFHESLKNGLGGSPAAAAPSGNVGNDQHCYLSLCVTCTLKIVWFVLYAPVQSADYKSRLCVKWDSVVHTPRINRCKARLAEGREAGAPRKLQSVSLWPTGTGQQEMRSAEPPKATP